MLTSITFLILIYVPSIWGNDQRYPVTIMPIDTSCALGSKRVLVHEKELRYLDADGVNIYSCKDGVKTVLFQGVNAFMDWHIHGDTLISLVAYRSDDTVTLIGRSVAIRTGKTIKEHTSIIVAELRRTPYLTNEDDVHLVYGDSIIISSLFADSIVMRSLVNLEPESRISRTGTDNSYWCLTKLDGRNLWYVEFAQSIHKAICLPRFVVAKPDTLKPLGITVYDGMVYALCHADGNTALFRCDLESKGNPEWSEGYCHGELGMYFGAADGYLYVKYEQYVHKIHLASPK